MNSFALSAAAVLLAFAATAVGAPDVADTIAPVLLARARTADDPIAGFVPKLWPAAVAAVLFGVAAVYQWILLFRKGRKFMLTLTIAMSCMTLGYALRIVYAGSPLSLGLYIVTTMFVLLTPCAFLAMDYVIFKKIAASLDPTTAEACLIIPTRRIVKLFVWSDGITFFLQMSGSGLSAAQSANMAKIAKYITLIGLGVQLASFVLFTVTLIIFGARMRSRFPLVWAGTPRGYDSYGSAPAKKWTTLYFTIRSCFRLAEYSQGYFGYLAVREGFFYALDALPLFLAMGSYCLVWPPAYIALETQVVEDANLESPQLKMRDIESVPLRHGAA
ncbi:hypothetical protein RQP46_003728 [Phenoliferia psychrophenolica]